MVMSIILCDKECNENVYKRIGIRMGTWLEIGINTGIEEMDYRLK